MQVVAKLGIIQRPGGVLPPAFRCHEHVATKLAPERFVQRRYHVLDSKQRELADDVEPVGVGRNGRPQRWKELVPIPKPGFSRAVALPGHGGQVINRAAPRRKAEPAFAMEAEGRFVVERRKAVLAGMWLQLVALAEMLSQSADVAYRPLAAAHVLLGVHLVERAGQVAVLLRREIVVGGETTMS